MEQDFKRHKLYYLVLAVILLLGFSGFLLLSFDKQIQFVISIVICVSYAIWGIAHHYAEKNLNWKIMIEYTLFSLISLAILLSLVMRA